MKKSLFITFCLIVSQTFSQNLNLYYSGKFQKDKITVAKVTNDTIDIKCFFESSETCACETFEVFQLTKNTNGDFITTLHDNEEEFIEVNVYEGKINSILIQSNWGGPCCNLISGIYLVKPAPVAGSTATPKLTTLNVAPKRFMDFWETFQSKMSITDSVIKLIDFPYAVNCNFLDVSNISLYEFKENGVDVFVNGNAFIKNTFSTMNHPKNKGLFFGKQSGLYINEYLSAGFTEKYGDLRNIYVISELAHYNEEGGYKAYFHESNGTFHFIGFEGMEQGD